MAAVAEATVGACTNVVGAAAIVVVDKLGMKVSRNSCAARPWVGASHTVSKLRRAVSVKITVENSKRCNTAMECKRLKIVS